MIGPRIIRAIDESFIDYCGKLLNFGDRRYSNDLNNGRDIHRIL